MRIGIFTNNFTPLVDGVVVSINTFRKGLEALGHEVFIFAPQFKGYQDEDAHVFRYPSLPLRYRAQYPIPLATRRDEDSLKKHPLDLIHVQHPWGIARSAIKLARKFSIPIVFTNHTRYEFYVDYLPPILPKRLAIKLVEQAATRYANKMDAVIAPTPSIKDYLIRNGVHESLIRVLPSGIDQAALRAAPAAKLRERFHIPGDHKLILNFGRVGPEKNLPTILEAYQRLLSREKKISLVMAGGTKGAEAYLSSLKQLAKQLGIADQVYFTGLVPPEGRGGYFRESDIFIHASLSETQGLILSEAMMFGLPVVAIRASGVVDVVVNEENGLMTENSSEALAEGALRLIREDSLREKLSKGAKLTAQEYTIEAVTKRLVAVYQSLIN